MTYVIQIDHIYQGDSGSELFVQCTGSTASFEIIYFLGSGSGTLAYRVNPGDKMQTIGLVATSTGMVSTEIKDLTAGWDSRMSMKEIIDKSQVGEIDFWLCENTVPSACSQDPLGQIYFSALKTSSITISLGPHTGSLGSFLGEFPLTMSQSILSSIPWELLRPDPLLFLQPPPDLLFTI